MEKYIYFIYSLGSISYNNTVKFNLPNRMKEMLNNLVIVYFYKIQSCLFYKTWNISKMTFNDLDHFHRLIISISDVNKIFDQYQQLIESNKF